MSNKEEHIIEQKNRIYDFFRGKLTKNQEKELFNWIRTNKANFQLFDDIRTAYIQTGFQNIPENPTDNVKHAWERFNKMASRKARRNRRQVPVELSWLKIAASLLFFLVLGGAITYTFLQKQQAVHYTQISKVITPKGAKTTLILPDSTKVILNAGSKLMYDNGFGLKSRIVSLEGEGYFDVVTNKKKPFIVQTSYANVKAYGTKFNVKAYADGEYFTATLEEGNVEVEALTTNEKKVTYKLKPNQNFRYEIATSEITQQEKTAVDQNEELPVIAKKAKINTKKVALSKVNTKLYTSWKDESWVIQGMPMSDMAVELERRYNIDITIKSNTLKSYRFTGNIQNETFEQVLEILKLTTPLKYKLSKGKVEWGLDEKLEKEYSKILENK